MNKRVVVVLLGCALLMSGCATRIAGTVKLVDPHMQPVMDDKPAGITVNMINTTAALENASHAVKTDEVGAFQSEKGKLVPGLYKIEVSRIGYKTATQTIELKKNKTQNVELFLKKIPEGKRKSIRGSRSDEDKIINPGEVNIQPPLM